MSVIAKLMVRGQTEFGTGRLVELGCVCDNDLMAAYAGSEEDKLFTKYSPWGEMKIHQPEGWCLSSNANFGEVWLAPAPAFYVLALHHDEHEQVADPDADRYSVTDLNFPGCAAWAAGVCHAVTDFGGTKQVEFRGGGLGRIKGRAIEKLNWKMNVDNPGASDQFKPGERYWFVLYDAAKFDRNAAIRAAHGHVA